MFRFASSIIIVFLVLGCSTDALNEAELTLENSLSRKEVVLDNVIACAASESDSNVISVFFYPRPGARNFRCFETLDTTSDKNDFTSYTQVEWPILDVFNGFLKRFEVTSEEEKWVIVAFDEGEETHLSNPIRLKQNTKPTEYIEMHSAIDFSTNMPIFSWEDGRYDDTKIYFHVVSDSENKLLSGTYTFERIFQYYKLDNVVLNITEETPPTLKSGPDYNFSLLGVSEDNWVNLFAEQTFKIQ